MERRSLQTQIREPRYHCPRGRMYSRRPAQAAAKRAKKGSWGLAALPRVTARAALGPGRCGGLFLFCVAMASLACIRTSVFCLACFALHRITTGVFGCLGYPNLSNFLSQASQSMACAMQQALLVALLV